MAKVNISNTMVLGFPNKKVVEGVISQLALATAGSYAMEGAVNSLHKAGYTPDLCKSPKSADREEKVKLGRSTATREEIFRSAACLVMHGLISESVTSEKQRERRSFEVDSDSWATWIEGRDAKRGEGPDEFKSLNTLLHAYMGKLRDALGARCKGETGAGRGAQTPGGNKSPEDKAIQLFHNIISLYRKQEEPSNILKDAADKSFAFCKDHDCLPKA